MSFRIDENVIWFDISVNIVHLVHIFNSENELSDIEFCLRLCEDVFVDEKFEKISPWDPLHSDVKV